MVDGPDPPRVQPALTAAVRLAKEPDLGVDAPHRWIQETPSTGTSYRGYRLEEAAGRPKATDCQLTACHHGQRAHGKKRQRNGKRWVPLIRSDVTSSRSDNVTQQARLAPRILPCSRPVPDAFITILFAKNPHNTQSHQGHC